MSTPRAAPSPWQIVSRIGAAVLGGWLFACGFVVLGIALLSPAGLGYEDAQTLGFLLAFPIYLAMVCWAFAAASVLRVWLVLAGGGVAMMAAGWWLARLLH